jgi:hypothetical protein
MAAFDAAPFAALPLARQAEYDMLFKELTEQEGMTYDEAAKEAVDTFSGDYDTGLLFVYTSKEEEDVKLKVESHIKAIEAAASGQGTLVNATFAFQGLRPLLSSAPHQGTWRLVEARGLTKTLVELLRVPETEEDAEDAQKMVTGEEEEDDDEEDEDENKVLLTLSVLDFTVFLLEAAATSARFLRSVEGFATLTDVKIAELLARLDEDVGEPRVVAKVLPLLTILLRVPANKELFLAASGVAALDLAAKMNKSLAEPIADLVGSLT